AEDEEAEDDDEEEEDHEDDVASRPERIAGTTGYVVGVIAVGILVVASCGDPEIVDGPVGAEPSRSGNLVQVWPCSRGVGWAQVGAVGAGDQDGPVVKTFDPVVGGVLEDVVAAAHDLSVAGVGRPA